MRHDDWEKRLSETIKAASKRPFSWGEFDCSIFAADCSIAVCEIDPASEYRGTYNSALGARKAQIKFGSIADALDRHFERTPVSLAQRGDIVIFKGPYGVTAGVIWNGTIWSTGQNGVGVVDTTAIDAWRVQRG